MESRFFEPPGENEIGSNYWEVQKMRGKIIVFDWGRELVLVRVIRSFEKPRIQEIRILLYMQLISKINKYFKIYF